MEMSPLSILLIVLVVAGIWAVVELALTIRRARGAVDDVTRAANETIEQVQPVIAKLDGAMDDLQPSLKQVDPIVAKASVALDEANEGLRKVNGILGDVSTVSGTAAGVTDVVNQVTNAAADAASGIVSKITGVPQATGAHHLKRGDGAAAIEAPKADEPPAPETAPEEQSHGGTGYVTYGEVGGAAAKATDEKDEKDERDANASE